MTPTSHTVQLQLNWRVSWDTAKFPAAISS